MLYAACIKCVVHVCAGADEFQGTISLYSEVRVGMCGHAGTQPR